MQLELAGRFAIVFAACLATTRVDGGNRVLWSVALTAIWLLAVQAGFAANATGLFPLGATTAMLHGVALGFVGASAFTAWFAGPRFDLARLIVCAAIILVLVTAWHNVVRRVTEPPRILVVGGSGAGQDIAHELLAERHPPFRLLGIVADPEELDAELRDLTIGGLDRLAEIVHSERPEIVVVAVERNRPAIFAPLLETADVGFRVVDAPQFSEHAFGRVPVRDIQHAWFMSVLHLYRRPYSRAAKRMFDIVVACFGLLVTLPLVPVVALLVRLSPGPLLVRQERLGEFGRPFTMFKFRTMRSNAEEPGYAVWAQENDPRVTATGRLMRRLRLDEIPQLWNVLRGEMSIVGPRPERPEFTHFLEQRVPFWSHRQLVKPGITGWAQVRRGYTADAEGSVDKLSYDLWYLRHRSTAVDLAICLRTLGVLLTGTPDMRERRVPASEPSASWGRASARSAASGNSS